MSSDFTVPAVAEEEEKKVTAAGSSHSQIIISKPEQTTGLIIPSPKPLHGTAEGVQSGTLPMRKDELLAHLTRLQSKRLELVATIKAYRSPRNPRRKNLANWKSQMADQSRQENDDKIEKAWKRVEAKIQEGLSERQAALTMIDEEIEQVEEYLRLFWIAPVTAEDALRLAIEDSDDRSDGNRFALVQPSFDYMQNLDVVKGLIKNDFPLMSEISLFMSMGNDLHNFCLAVGARSARKIRCEYFSENMKYIASARSRKDFLRTIDGLDKTLATIAAADCSDVNSNRINTLKYPFAASSRQLDEISSDMIEVAGELIAPVPDDNDEIICPGACTSETVSEPISIQCDAGTLRFLSSWQYMNDSLVEFFMRWMTRKEDPATSNILVFPSKFFGLINDDESEAVSWTKERSIDIFTKRFILLPISDGCLTSSLCVVVNPNYIGNEFLGVEDQRGDQDFPVIWFFDALGVQLKKKIASKVRKWLNREARHLGKFMDLFEINPQPFNKKTTEIFAPKVPRSSNLIDAGLYVCRYARAIYHMRNTRITYENTGVEDKTPYFRDLITESEEFNFDSNDIKNMGKEMKTLIGRLLAMHLNLDLENIRNLERETKTLIGRLSATHLDL